MVTTVGLRAGIALVFVGLCFSPFPVFSQVNPTAPGEGKLDKFIDRDAQDASTKLEVIEQTLYEQQQEITLLMFLNQYSSRIRMERVMYPSADAHLIPGYIFTSASIDKGKKTPVVILVHGGFHEHLDWR